MEAELEKINTADFRNLMNMLTKHPELLDTFVFINTYGINTIREFIAKDERKKLHNRIRKNYKRQDAFSKIIENVDNVEFTDSVASHMIEYEYTLDIGDLRVVCRYFGAIEGDGGYNIRYIDEKSKPVLCDAEYITIAEKIGVSMEDDMKCVPEDYEDNDDVQDIFASKTRRFLISCMLMNKYHEEAFLSYC